MCSCLGEKETCSRPCIWVASESQRCQPAGHGSHLLPSGPPAHGTSRGWTESTSLPPTRRCVQFSLHPTGRSPGSHQPREHQQVLMPGLQASWRLGFLGGEDPKACTHLPPDGLLPEWPRPRGGSSRGFPPTTTHSRQGGGYLGLGAHWRAWGAPILAQTCCWPVNP